MIRDFFQSLVTRAKRLRKPTSLVGHDYDLRLLARTAGRRWPRFKQLVHMRRILSPVERRALHVSLLTFVVGFLWSGYALAKQYRVDVPARGGRYIEAVVGSPGLVNPLFAQLNDVDMDITRLVYSGLMRYDDKQRLVPDLAAAPPTVSDDKKTYTFELRKDVKWHDGEPFTANDVMFTFQTIQDPAVSSPLFVTFQGIAVKVIDDYHISFTLKEAFAPFLSSLTIGILPKHVWADVAPGHMTLSRANLQPIGTGPFAFSKLTKDDSGNIYRYELNRFADYYRQPAYLDQFVFQFFPSYDGQTGAVQAIREQRVDGVSFVPHDLKDSVERKHIDVHTLSLPQYTALFFNKDHAPLLKDDAVRSALAEALDRERILHDAINGEGQIINSPILPGFPGYSADATSTSYAVDQANKALDAVSVRVSAEEYRASRKTELVTQATASLAVASSTDAASSSTIDILVESQLDQELNPAQIFFRKTKTKDATVLSLKLVTADTKEYHEAAELIAGFWQEIGIETSIAFVSPKDISKTVLKNRDYDVLLYGEIVGSDPDQYPFWHSSQIDYPGLNLARYVNRQADSYLEKARTATTDEERADAYAHFRDILIADHPAIFLYTPTYRYATNDKIHGISITSIFEPSDRFANVANWYMKTKGQWHFGN